MPEDGYGWEKLFSERMAGTSSRTTACRPGSPATTTSTASTARGTGGREKAPAAICRKVATAAITGEHTIDDLGRRARRRARFMYIDDCVHGTQMITNGDDPSPVNLGSDELVSINELVDIVEKIAGVTLERKYDLSAPQGVRGRSSDNTEIIRRYGWAPSVPLADGLERTYRWIYDEVAKTLA